MHKRMEQLDVTVIGGSQVEIRQDSGNGERPDCILLHSSQIPTLIAWLREAKKEAEAE